MTYLPSATKEFTSYCEAPAVDAKAAGLKAGVADVAASPRKRGFLATLFDAVWHARQRQADAEIARYLAMSGGKLTDSAEREIERRFGSGNFRVR